MSEGQTFGERISTLLFIIAFDFQRGICVHVTGRSCFETKTNLNSFSIPSTSLDRVLDD